MADDRLSLADAAREVGVTAPTLKRWAESGVVPELRDGQSGWGPAAVSHARMVARLRERGHSLASIREASDQGRLAYGFVEDTFPGGEGTHSLQDAAKSTGLEASLIERFWAACGLPRAALETLSDDDVQALEYIASVLGAGFPWSPSSSSRASYGQTLSQIADAEVRLFHLYVHEPLMREGVPGLQM
ncbi:MAG: helix-turn-helix domain-containing protein, partial [Actinomycetota bacterium]|nr:helix-turn-helix domain-containing protein [Actinomycetota bacterium]